MKVTVRLYAGLPEKLISRGMALSVRGCGAPVALELAEASPVAALLAALRLERSEVLSAFVNGRARPMEHVLEPGDEVGLFPPIGGG